MPPPFTFTDSVSSVTTSNSTSHLTPTSDLEGSPALPAFTALKALNEKGMETSTPTKLKWWQSPQAVISTSQRFFILTGALLVALTLVFVVTGGGFGDTEFDVHGIVGSVKEFGEKLTDSAKEALQHSTTPESPPKPRYNPDEPLNEPNFDYHYCAAPLPDKDQVKSHQEKFPSHKLVQVHILHRHGDRSPLHLLPNEQQSNWDDCKESKYVLYETDRLQNGGRSTVVKQKGDDKEVDTEEIPKVAAAAERKMTIPDDPITRSMFNFWRGNCFMGQLTDTGAEQLRELGNRLREIYVDGGLLPDVLDENALDALAVRSTDVPRTVHSGSMLLLGLYPPSKRKVDSIPFEIHPKNVDALYGATSACKRLHQLYYEVFPNEPEWVSYRASIQDELEEIARRVGLTAKDLAVNRMAGGEFADTFHCRECHDIPSCYISDEEEKQKKCVTHEMMEKTWKWREWEDTWQHRNSRYAKEHNKLYMGLFLVQALMNAQMDQHRFFHYSAHDSTVQALLGVLEAKDLRWPPYRSHIIIELWEETGEGDKKGDRYVRILYNGQVLKSDVCDWEMCPLSQVATHFGSYIPTDFGEACKEVASEKSEKAKEKAKKGKFVDDF